MTPYQICKRQRMELRIMARRKFQVPSSKLQRRPCEVDWSLEFGASWNLELGTWNFSFDAIPVSPSGRDEVRAEFLAQVRNVDVEEVRHRAVVFVEEMFVKRRAGDEFAAMQREILEQRIFARGERHRLAGAQDGAGGDVDGHVADLERIARLVRATAVERAPPGEQLGGGDGVDDE